MTSFIAREKEIADVKALLGKIVGLGVGCRV